MNKINPSKKGDCTLCEATNTYCIKRGKDLFCLSCAKSEKVKEQIVRQQQKIAAKIPDFDLSGDKQLAKMQLGRWFLERRDEMTGVCKHCGGRTEKYNDATYRFSIAHILPKKYFPSVVAHPLNWIELCFWNKSCHTNLDNLSLDIVDLKCFDEVIEKFVAMYPAIARKERKRIPQVLMQYILIEN